MFDIESKKNELENAIVNTMITAAKNNIISDEEISIISSVILDNIDYMEDEVDYRAFLSDISSRWDIFKPLLTIELGKDQQKLEEERIKQILQLTQQGNIESALNMAKATTNNVI